jgi:hypothetical protein
MHMFSKLVFVILGCGYYECDVGCDVCVEWVEVGGVCSVLMQAMWCVHARVRVCVQSEL